MTRAAILRDARKLIEKPERWTQYHYAVNRVGRTVLTSAPEAYARCAAGALIAAAPSHPNLRGEAADLLEEACHQSITTFNDAHGRTHLEVLAAFDRAIALAEKEGTR